MTATANPPQEVPLKMDDRAARLALVLIRQLRDEEATLVEVGTLLKPFPVKSGRSLTPKQIHLALAQIGWLYVAAVKEAAEKHASI
jgi:hypothetical protein